MRKQVSASLMMIVLEAVLVLRCTTLAGSLREVGVASRRRRTMVLDRDRVGRDGMLVARVEGGWRRGIPSRCRIDTRRRREGKTRPGSLSLVTLWIWLSGAGLASRFHWGRVGARVRVERRLRPK